MIITIGIITIIITIITAIIIATITSTSLCYISLFSSSKLDFSNAVLLVLSTNFKCSKPIRKKKLREICYPLKIFQDL